MGFEFEFGMLKTNISKIKVNNKNILDNEKIYIQLIKELCKLDNTKPWVDILTFTVDDTVQIEDGVGIEVITAPLEGESAFEIYCLIQEVLNKNDFITNGTCGMHVNVSSNDKKIIDLPVESQYHIYQEIAYNITRHINIEEINKMYGRVDNPHCQDGLSRLIPTEDIPSFIKNKYSTIKQQQFIDFRKLFEIIIKNNDSQFKSFANLAIRKLLNEDWNAARPAIVARKNDKEAYIEFRSIGNNYSKNMESTNKGLKLFLNAFLKESKKAISNIKKPKQKAL